MFKMLFVFVLIIGAILSAPGVVFLYNQNASKDNIQKNDQSAFMEECLNHTDDRKTSSGRYIVPDSLHADDCKRLAEKIEKS